MEHLYTTISLSTWQDFKNFVDSLSENWAFRGQASAAWDLNNAIERTEFIHFYKGIEVDFLAEFERGARNYLLKDETPEHILEWLALMQHHGAPTRLLDLTKSPFIASYFAFEQCYARQKHPIAIWAINYIHLKTKALEVLSQQFPEAVEESKHLINEKLFEKIFYQNDCSLVFPVEPFRMNRRYSLQQSIFVSTGRSEEPFMKQLFFLGEDISRAVIKMELPAALQREVLRDLQKMNLNRASIFPDLDGYAMSLRLRYNSMKTVEERLETSVLMLEKENFRFFP